jgi:L-ascorbate metabolism protein UlaG (beta-lactamase superfamily)
MTERFPIWILTAASMVGMLTLAPTRAAAQAQGSAAAAKAKWARDFNGEWSPTGVGGGSKLLLPGEEVSLTPFGAEQYNKIDEADSPAYRCEPYGPNRMMTSALPFRVFQQEDRIGMIFEHIDYRIIYMHSKHPDDILDYPEWAGNSIGKWDGDTLVVDTIGMREESWLDSNGLQHSGKLHMVERYKKTSPDTFVWIVTIDDPVYFTKPFTYANNFERDDFRIVPDRCEDTPPTGAPGEKYTTIKGKAGPSEPIPPTFPPGVARTYIGADQEKQRDADRARRLSAMVKKTKFEDDVINTSHGDLKVTSVTHYSVMFNYGGKVVAVDPVGQAADYSLLPKADVILVTHVGADHLDADAIKAISTDKTALLVCPHCWMYLQNGSIMINGETRTVAGLKIEAIPAYNIKGQLGNGKPNTSRGTSNGYVITFGDKRVYVAGETEDVPELRSQKQIDVAFLPVNSLGRGEGSGGAAALRTMTPKMFTDAVKAMRPKIVFPYAYGNNDPKMLAELMKGEQGIDVRVRDMR